MDQHHHEPQPPAAFSNVRHDGWTGEKMAIFCETLAETAVVAEACDVASMGISGAYAARRRNPYFAAAWDAALSIARERLADELLSRSIEGNVEQIYKDGVLVGERHVIDNRLGLAILRRLDRLADTGLSTSSRGVRAPAAPEPARKAFDWILAVDALRTGDDEGVAEALALAKSYEVEEVEGPPDSLIDDDYEDDCSARCWKAGFNELPPEAFEGQGDVIELWATDFPPPPGFTGYENHPYDEPEAGESYIRVCTPDEAAILEARDAAEQAAWRAEEEQTRDDWFTLLRNELENAAEAITQSATLLASEEVVRAKASLNPARERLDLPRPQE